MAEAVSDKVHAYVQDVLVAARAAKSNADLARVVEPAFEAFGYQTFSAIQVKPPLGEATGKTVYFGKPNHAWRECYLEHEYYRTDELLKRMLNDFQPFTWSGYMRSGQAGEDQKRMHAEADNCRVRDAYVLPVFNPDQSVLGLMLTSDRSVELDERQSDSLFLLSYRYVHLGWALMKPVEPPKEAAPVLTPRQRQCLILARTMSDRQIAEHLNISPHTVIEHMEETRRRLGVKTRAQAVIEALQRGLIPL